MSITPSPAKHHGRPTGTPKTGGRVKGTPNRINRVLKDAILLAGEKAGGKEGLVGYLEKQAVANPAAYMSLLGKVLPMTVDATGIGAQAVVLIRTGVPRADDDDRTIDG
jgi:hypothetical protein